MARFDADKSILSPRILAFAEELKQCDSFPWNDAETLRMDLIVNKHGIRTPFSG